MKAGLLRAPNVLALEDVAESTRKPGDLILKVRAATVCGTDIRVLRGRKRAGIRYPSIIGHEFAGEVVKTAPDSGLEAGQRVCVDPAIPCGRCASCKLGHENICEDLRAIGYEIDGAFAEYVRIPARALATGNVHPIPEHLAFEQAALAEPFACVINGQEQVGVGAGDPVTVLGAGPIGLLHVKLARLSGARLVIVSEPSAPRRQAALEAGADMALDLTAGDLAGTVRAATRGLSVEVVIVGAGINGAGVFRDLRLQGVDCLLVVHALIGGKWTTFRGFAEEAADRVLADLGRRRFVDTRLLPIGGGRGFPATIEARAELVARIAECGVSPSRATTLLDRYGTRAVGVAGWCGVRQDAPLPSLPDYSRAEIGYILSNELVGTLADVVFRRTDIALSGRLTPAVARGVADVARDMLGWSAERCARDVAEITRLAADRHGMADRFDDTALAVDALG